MPVYNPREKNVIQEILQDHFKSFEYWKENIKLFQSNNFITELTQHIPPKLGTPHTLLRAVLQQDVKDGSLAKYGYTPVPQKVPEHAADPEMETT